MQHGKQIVVGVYFCRSGFLFCRIMLWGCRRPSRQNGALT